MIYDPFEHRYLIETTIYYTYQSDSDNGDSWRQNHGRRHQNFSTIQGYSDLLTNAVIPIVVQPLQTLSDDPSFLELDNHHSLMAI